MPKSITFTAPLSVIIRLAGFEVAMDDAHAVRVRERRERLHAELGRALRRERAHARDHGLERLAADVLHHHQPFAFVLEQLVDGGDARMAQPRDRDRLRAEPPRDFGVVQFGVEDLDGDVAMEHLVHRAIHGAHAATAKAIGDTVLSDNLADHGEPRS